MIIAPTPQAIAKACRFLRDGSLIGMPTETVYGLAGDACQDRAVAQIFAVKRRPAFNPLIIHVASKADAEKLALVPEKAYILMQAFWPGALTLVLPRAPGCPVSLLASAGLDTLALRCPDHPVAQQLLNGCGCPLAAPSANRSMAISPTSAGDVAASLGEEVALILDGGACEIGLESTILDLSMPVPTLLRPGGITLEALEAVIGAIAIAGKSSVPKAPGMMPRHYAPRRPLRLNAADCQAGEALLGFGATDGLEAALNLSQTGNLTEAAANLFRMMRQLDADPYTAIAVMPVPDYGLGAAINDRLQRATAPENEL